MTSDSQQSPLFRRPEPNIYPGRAPFYVAPHDDVFPTLATNVRPLVVEITVTSNVVRRTTWYLNGALNTNEFVLSSNMVSRMTNALDTTNGSWVYIRSQ